MSDNASELEQQQQMDKILGSLRIVRAAGGNGAQMVNRSGEGLSIPQGPPPGKVFDFKYIEISYVDQTVIKFLERILFNSSGTTLAIYTSGYQSRSWEIIWQKIWPLVNDNICGFFLHVTVLYHLRQFSPAILRNCPNLRLIDSIKLFPEFPAEDNAEASSNQALAKCRYSAERMDELRTSFVTASESVNFIIRFLEDDHHFVPFEEENNLTRERLTFRFIGGYGLLVRCPIGREEDKWTNWEEEAIEWQCCRQQNCIAITFKDSDIGDGMVGASEGPSEPTD
uniref:F-box protein n=1 Tax=Globodera rostochiensis TaxID=31243 RepID=A0A914GQ35_GLORO